MLATVIALCVIVLHTRVVRYAVYAFSARASARSLERVEENWFQENRALRLTSNTTKNESLDTLAREFNLVPVYTMILSTCEYLERQQGRTARCLSTTGQS